MVSARAITANANHARAADQHDPGLLREGSAQGGAFIPRRDNLRLRQSQFLRQQGGSAPLQLGSLLDSASADRGGMEIVAIHSSGDKSCCNAVPHCTSEPLFPLLGIEMADTGSLARAETVQLPKLAAADSAAGAGLTCVESGDQHWLVLSSEGRLVSVARQNQPMICTSGRKKMVSAMPCPSRPAIAARLARAVPAAGSLMRKP